MKWVGAGIAVAGALIAAAWFGIELLDRRDPVTPPPPAVATPAPAAPVSDDAVGVTGSFTRIFPEGVEVFETSCIDLRDAYVEVYGPDDTLLGIGPFESEPQVTSDPGCSSSFSVLVEPAQLYRFAIYVEDPRPGRIDGPTYSHAELVGQDFHVDLRQDAY